MVLHMIEQGENVWKGTDRENLWMISHDALSILWNESTQQWLQTLKCPISGWEERTWADRFIKICGKWNDLVHKRYQNSLPGDSPEVMPLDCHLFSDVKEGVARNVALTYFLDNNDPIKYSLSTPHKAELSIWRTIKAGCPSPERILTDCNNCVKNLKRIVDANGVYIDDSNRTGVRAEAKREANRSLKTSSILIKADPDAINKFEGMFQEMKAGQGVPKRLWETLQVIDDVPPPPQEIITVHEDEELDSGDKSGDDSQMEEIEIQKTVTDLCSDEDDV
jgi:hypothetical protein